MIQAAARGWLVRLPIMAALEELRIAYGAVTIQRHWRGAIDRQRVMAALDGAVAETAARTIQEYWIYTKVLRARHNDDMISEYSNLQQDMAFTTRNRWAQPVGHQQATREETDMWSSQLVRIQARVRGFQSRQQTARRQQARELLGRRQAVMLINRAESRGHRW